MKADAISCPYVGLRPFSARERRVFFGRTREQRVIFSSLSASPLTVLYGPTGTGKSSVLQAGLIPMVRIHTRRTGIVYFNRWHNASFLDDLKQQCIDEARHVARKKSFTVAAALPLDELIEELRRHVSRPMLIVLDQFEEYLHYYPESNRESPFEAQLARAIALGEGGASFLIALREDALSRLDRFRTRIPNLLANTLRLDALNKIGAEEAIRKPLDVYRQYHGDSNGPVEIEDALVTRILDEVCLVHPTQLGDAVGEGGQRKQVASDKIEASILQLVMERLWYEERDARSRILRLETLERLGGVAHIVQTYFARVMEHFSPAEWETCAAIFRFLVTPSGSKVAYTLDDLAESAERPDGEVETVLKKLVEYTVLRRIEAPERYELLHDILAPAVTGWRNRHVQAREMAREAEARDAQFAAKRKSLTLRVAIIAAVLFMGLGVLAAIQWRRADHAAKLTKRALAQLVAAKFQESAVKSDKASGKELLFLLRARDVLKTNFRGKDQAEQLALIDERLAEAITSWTLPSAELFAFTYPRHQGDFLTVDDRLITWWDVETKERRRGIDLTPTYASQGDDGEVPSSEPGIPGGIIDSVQMVSRDGRRVVLSTSKGTIIWDLVKDDKTVLPYLGSPGRVLALSDSDDRLLVQWGKNRDVWENASSLKGRTLPGTFDATGLLFRAGASQIVAMEGAVLKLRDMKSRSGAVREFRSERGTITQFALSPDGNQLAFAEDDGAIRLVKLDNPQKTEPRILSAPVQDWKTLAFDRESRRLAAFAADGRTFLWNVQHETLEQTMTGPPANEAIFSHDLRWIATSSPTGILLRAITSAPPNILAEAQKRAHGQLDFEDIVDTYDELTPDFRRGVEFAVRELNVTEAARRFRAALAVFREVDQALHFDPDAEARRLTASGFLARAEKEAREGEYETARADYAQAQTLFPAADPSLAKQQLREWAIQALLRRADVAAAKGDLDSALKDLYQARFLGAEVGADAEKRFAQSAAEARINEARRKLDLGERQAALDLFDEALKLNPGLAASLNPQREINKADARGLIRKALGSLEAGRVVDAIREYAQAQALAGAPGEQEFAESRALARAGYDTFTGALEIEFRSGAVYRYAAAPPELYDGLLRADSKGRYFSEQIRGKYFSERLQREPLAPVLLGDQMSLGRLAGELLKAADKAVTLDPSNIALRQTRGVARALAGDFPGAADDLLAYASDPSRANTDFGRQNKTWAEQLRQGTNPFTSEILQKLPTP